MTTLIVRRTFGSLIVFLILLTIIYFAVNSIEPPPFRGPIDLSQVN